jgi:hypothetical protein
MSSIKDKILFYLICTCFLLGLFFIHKNWFFSFTPLVSGDWPYFYVNAMKEWFPLHSAWMNYESMGRPMTQLNFTILFSFYAWFSILNIDFEIISRILFFYPIALGAPLFSYIFLYRASKNKMGAILGATAYTFNSYFLVIQGGHLNISFVYALAPLILFLFTERKFYFQLTGVLVVFLTSIYEVRLAPLMLCFAITFFWLKNTSSRKDLGINFIISVTDIIIFLILNFFWVITFIKIGAASEYIDVFKQQSLNWVNILDSFSLHHPFWSLAGGVKDFEFQKSNALLFLLPGIAFIPIFFKKYFKKEVLFFIVVIVISIFFLNQENPPLGFFYVFLYKKISALSAFRESSKFFIFIAIAYSYLLNLFLKYVSEKFTKNFFILKSAIAILIFIALIIPSFPYFMGIYIKTYAKAEKPHAIIALQKFIKNQPALFKRTLWISHSPKFVENSYLAPSLDGIQYGNQVSLVFYVDSKEPLAYLNKNYSQWLMNKSSIFYIVSVSKEDDSQYRQTNNLPQDFFDKLLVKFSEKKIIRGENEFKSSLLINDTAEPYI